MTEHVDAVVIGSGQGGTPFLVDHRCAEWQSPLLRPLRIPHLRLFPSLAITLVLAFNVVGDGLRAALDPRSPT